MARVLALVLALAFLMPADVRAEEGSPGAASAWWVLFRDRGPEPRDAELEEAARAVAPRALARRARAARERAIRDGAPRAGATLAPEQVVDERDLDPAPSYVAAVTAAGATLRTRSRWLNAVSVDGGPGAIAAIRTLPFVRGVLPVATAEPSRPDRVSGSGTEIAPPPAAPPAPPEHIDGIHAADASEYGPGWRQVEMLGIPEAHAMGFHGEGVLVCVLDSGFERTHEAFDLLTVRAERDFIHHDGDTGHDPRQDLPSQPNHGTAVLSLIAGYAPGKIVGPAFAAEYLLGKTEAIGSETRQEEDAWCAAVEWAEALGADILTSSLSYPQFYRSADLDGRTAVNTRAANLALERGLLIVNSTGNYGPGERSLAPPSDAPGVLAVGSVDANGQLSPFSSIGPTRDGRLKPDLVAMGTAARHVAPHTRDRYAYGNGTSYSAPLVAGCAAIVLSAHPDWGPEAVRDALTLSGDRASRPDPRYGWGVPNVRDAILYPLLEGRILDAHTKEPVREAVIHWEPVGSVDTRLAAPSDSPPRGSVRADTSGAYVIPNLPAGSYRLRIEAPGYFDRASDPLEVPPSLGDVNLELRYRGE